MTDAITQPHSSSNNNNNNNNNTPIDHTQPISYHISTTENDLGRVRWEIKDSQNRLVFKSFKELTQTEIVESIQDPSGESLWSIHRPTKGWYLALRTPKATSSQNFIALEPRNVTKGKNRMVEFTFRLKSTSFSVPTVDKPTNGFHKHTNSNSSIKRRHASISSLPKSPNRSTSRATSPERELPLQPLESLVVRLHPIDQDVNQVSIFKSFTDLFINNNQRIECYIDSPSIPHSNSLMSNDEANQVAQSKSTINSHPKQQQQQQQQESHNRIILFDYQDQNSVFGIQNNGILKLHLKNTLKLHLLDDNHDLNQLAFHQAFWISVCIAYLGFRADQDAYVAAIQGD